MESINNFFLGVNSGLEYVFTNKLISNLVLVFLMLYISLIAPPLPESTEKILDNGILQMILIILIGYLLTKNLPVVIVSTVALIVTLQMMKVKKFDMDLVKRIFRMDTKKKEKEGFENKSYNYEDTLGSYGLDIQVDESNNEQTEEPIIETEDDKCENYGVINDFSKLNPTENVSLQKVPVKVDEYYTSLGAEYSDMIVGARKLEDYGEIKN